MGEIVFLQEFDKLFDYLLYILRYNLSRTLKSIGLGNVRIWEASDTRIMWFEEANTRNTLNIMHALYVGFVET